MDIGLQEYEKQKKSINNFFPRFPTKPDFNEKIVLEFGCGRGAFSLSLANENPKKIVGIDTNSKYINLPETN